MRGHSKAIIFLYIIIIYHMPLAVKKTNKFSPLKRAVF